MLWYRWCNYVWLCTICSVTLPDVFLCCFWNGQLGQENLSLTEWNKKFTKSAGRPGFPLWTCTAIRTVLRWTALNSELTISQSCGSIFWVRIGFNRPPPFLQWFVCRLIHTCPYSIYKRWQPLMNHHGAEEHPGWAMPNRSSKMWCHPPTNAKPTPGLGAQILHGWELHHCICSRIPLSKT